MEGAYYKTFADSLSKFHTFECDVVDTHSKSLQNLKTATDNIDGPLDLKIFLADYTNTFAAQKDFKYDAGEGDEVKIEVHIVLICVFLNFLRPLFMSRVHPNSC